MESDRRALALAERQFSVISRAQALACGLTPDAVDGRLDRGLWIAVHRAVYRISGALFTFQSRAMAGTLAIGEGAWASFLTAGSLWGLVGYQPDIIEVTVASRRTSRIRGLTIHRPRKLPASRRTRLGPIPIISPLGTIHDLAKVLTEQDLECAIDIAARKGIVRPETLMASTANLGPGHSGATKLRKLANARRGLRPSESVQETLLFRLIRSSRILLPIPQYEIQASDGSLLARVDFAYPQHMIAIEFDSFEFHSNRRAWERDRHRDSLLFNEGWLVLRFTAGHLRDRPGLVVSTIKHALKVRVHSGKH